MKNIFLSLSMLFCIYTNAQTFTLKSNDIGGQATNKQVFSGFGCTGGNTSPELSWSNAPVGTKSFAVTMYDPDAPTGSGWWHWVVFDIPENEMQLKQNAGNLTLDLAPNGSVQSLTDFGKAGYGGPCPPEGHGFHQYIITVYALKTKMLGLDKNANPALVGYYLNGNTIEKASIVAYYKR
ncbi:kinase inhibitor [Flavobacterium psychrophilum]|uniref:YbhB/YbcL family Raf kinase inhibitor-like protein n=1 Tax=Flavobacterium psychrophilum TaxID=96345 RepID=UPI0009044B54|nr:YbhB/YbcL family Raf kinase inhibitor-like protein [Flavobacterium psychrophilum]OJH13193.1 kinase inhibitor [Flavobacterium psychrophilum]SNA78872.1 putative kinase inhibitor; DLP12 prophage [Flavobacterium psychrophilum]